ncbi:branched-chain amino acid ABC transporter substrate-binding protein [Thioclava marina]|uniref:Branched-chain amino acid ABC transporter substrate-binding protein n=1 Tax=Thioclava marina TaxID=1915077 RepID=A0ABX3MLK9_9RHOB|nr:branched-chain amino acid ABC transporter substrate-binding protein [Thioclava marina]
MSRPGKIRYGRKSLAFQWLIGACAALVLATQTQAEVLRIDWIERQVSPPPVLSNMAAIPSGLGLDGARLAERDIATTGRFTGQSYDLHETVVAPDADFLKAAKSTLAEGARVLVVKAPAPDLLALADLPEAQGALILDAYAQDDALRGADCRANVLHTAPSYAMRTDALAQFLLKKQWRKLVLIAGQLPEDLAFTAALKRSLTKFGLNLAGEKTWDFDANMRRAAAAEVPLFTQDLPAHDLLLVSDEPGDFARYIAYNTWVARPLAGSEGLKPVGWSGVVEQYGAAQLQNRFREAAGREMQQADFAAWIAVAALGEAFTRTQSTDPAMLRTYMLSDAFRLAGFLGRPLSFRNWNGQLRQPIPLVTERAVAALAPLEGFLHQINELDTLGVDAPESPCTAFGDAR